jgi:peptidoglycan/xylan/chitin deacetylase (PgdA/CDA1 family)
MAMNNTELGGGSDAYWPSGSKFALCLTHDVDRVDKTWWQCAYYLLKKRDPYQLRSLVNRKKERPFWNFERIMEIERKHGVRSTFFFLNETKRAQPLRPSTYPLAFGNYDINDPRVVSVIRELDAGGWEIGVHGSYDSYLRQDLLVKEKDVLEKILGKPVLGIRQHYLNLDIPATWELQAEAGFKYDSSFGWRDKVDFRDGKDRPFRPFGNGLLEIPMTIMDGPLFASGEGVEEAWKRCQKLIDRAEERGGLLTILWHNNRFNDNEYPGQTGIYERIIEECQRRGAWVTTGGKVYRWCTGR